MIGARKKVVIRVGTSNVAGHGSLTEQILLCTVVTFVASTLVTTILVVVNLVPLGEGNADLPYGSLTSCRAAGRVCIRDDTTVSGLGSMKGDIGIGVGRTSYPSQVRSGKCIRVACKGSVRHSGVVGVLGSSNLKVCAILIQ